MYIFLLDWFKSIWKLWNISPYNVCICSLHNFVQQMCVALNMKNILKYAFV